MTSKRVALVAAAVVLGGCASNLGETKIKAEFEPPKERLQLAADATDGNLSTKAIQALMRPSPTVLTLTDGKDKKSVAWSLNTAEGVANYTASDVAATPPAKQRKQINENAGDDVVESFKAIPLEKLLKMVP